MASRRLFTARIDCCVQPLPFATLAIACGAVLGGASQPQCDSLPAEFSGSSTIATKPHGAVVRTTSGPMTTKPHSHLVRSNKSKATWLHWSHHGEKHLSMVCRPSVREAERQHNHATALCAKRAVRGTGLQPESEESFRRHATRIFEMFAAEDGALPYADVAAAVQICSVGRSDEGLPFVLGPLLWRLMNKGAHDGGATLEEFTVGQELLNAAKTGDIRSDEATRHAVEELCWRALTANSGDGPVGRTELSIMIRTMLHLDGLDAEAFEEINHTWAAKKVRMQKTGNGYFTTFSLEAIEYYMRMCDLNGDGVISRGDFSSCSSLQHSFWLLLSKPELEPISLVRVFGGGASE